MNRIFDIDPTPDADQRALHAAGTNDFVRLLPASDGEQRIVLRRRVLEVLTAAIVLREHVHVSGPTGTAKTALIEAMENPANMIAALSLLPGDVPTRPLRIHAVEMPEIETPGELWRTRELREEGTVLEDSAILKAFDRADPERYYEILHLRELGRNISPHVQSGLLNLLTRGPIRVPGRAPIPRFVSAIADSNYQPGVRAGYELQPMDEAVRRRLAVQLELEQLPADIEEQLLAEIAGIGPDVTLHAVAPAPARPVRRVVSSEFVSGLMRIAAVLRREQAEGNLRSVAPPTLFNMTTVIHLAELLPGHTLEDLALVTLLGNATPEDQARYVPGVLAEALGLETDDAESIRPTGDMF